MKGPMHDIDRLRFRRQFILGERFVETFPRWKRLELRPEIRLTVHPDLPAVRVQREGMSVVLLGYMINPYRPRATDLDIVARLLAHLEAGAPPESLIRQTHSFGGRWILIVDDGRNPWLFNDPCGYRQVVYTDTSRHRVWCASQPGLLAETLDLAPDGDATDFIRAFRRRQPEYWWPIDTSPYESVRHLIPNHYLNLETGTSHRFWPADAIPAQPLEDVASEAADLLQRLIESASHRLELALGITAGKDTRLLLAASRSIRDKLFCFTSQHWDLSPGSPDIQVPSRLLPQLGLTHHVIRCALRMQKGFADVYRQNVATAHEAYGSIAEGVYRYFPQDRVSMKGCAIPVTGAYYQGRLRREFPEAERAGINAETLARLARIPRHEFALNALSRWLEDAGSRSVRGLDILDQFLWEDREGNWQAMIQLEFDIGREVFVPYNCRSLLVNLLSVPEAERSEPAIALHTEMILRLWPEVLREPINPPAQPSLRAIARGFQRRPGCMTWGWLGSQMANWLRPRLTEAG